MFIIYGTGFKPLKTESGNNLICPNCQQKGSISFTIYQGYAHIYKIPLVPVYRKVVSYCQNCKQSLEANQMPPDFKPYAAKENFHVKTPLKMFAGVALIIFFIAVGIIGDMRQKDLEKQYLATPQVNDIYELKTSKGKYVFAKISTIKGDDITLLEGNYEYSTEPTSRQIDKDLRDADAFSEDLLQVRKTNLESLYQKGSISKIIRKN